MQGSHASRKSGNTREFDTYVQGPGNTLEFQEIHEKPGKLLEIPGNRETRLPYLQETQKILIAKLAKKTVYQRLNATLLYKTIYSRDAR